MKKVKFTLGLMFSMLLLGANVINGANNVKVSLSVSPSTSYANSTSINDFTSGDTNDAITFYSYDVLEDSIMLNPSFGGEDIRKYAKSYNIGTENDSVLSLRAVNYKDYYHVFEIQLAFENGNDIMPFLKLKIWNKSDSISIENLLTPVAITNKTKFSDGTGVATYKYIVNIAPFFLQYGPISSFDYELWTNERIGDQPGSGNAYPTVNHKVKIAAADGIVIAPMKDIYYVAANQDYTFEVYGQEGEELDITTKNPHYAINKGIKIVPTSERTWDVTISKVSTNLELFIDYKSRTESGEGGDNGESGNATVEKDAIWAAGGTLYVKTGTPGTLSIYTITGQLYKQEAISDSYTLSMPKGIYIVQLNGKAYKVVL